MEDGTSSEKQIAAYRFHVEGVESGQTFLPTHAHPYDETFEIEGEHPAEALEKLLREIEWSILDSQHGFTITYLPNGGDDGNA